MQNSTNEKNKFEKQLSVIYRYQQGDKSVEEEMFTLFDDLIKKIARKYDGNQISKDELVQAGKRGLWNGIKKYDAVKNNNPEMYLKPYIEGEMKNELRISASDIPRNIYYKVIKMRKERSCFEVTNGRLPDNIEMAAILKVTPREIEDWCQAEQFIGLASIDAENGEEDISIIDALTDGKSAEDAYVYNNDPHNFILESMDFNVREAPSELIENIIAQAEYFAKQCRLDKDEFLQIFKNHLKKEEINVDDSESEKEMILNAIFSDTNFYWPFSYRLIAYIKQKRPDLTDANSVMDFLTQQMEIKSIPYLNESIQKWFDGVDIQKSGEANFRDSMYKICFAMELGVDETNKFFKQVALDKAFYIRDVKEFVYYYCIKNELSYQMAIELIAQALCVDNEDRECHTLHETKVILESLVISRSNEKVIEYIRRNPQDFNIRNLTARRQIDNLIADICIRDEEKDIITKWQEIDKHKERVQSTLANDDATSIEAKKKREKISDLVKEQELLLKEASENSSVLFQEFVKNPQIIPKGSQITTEASMLTMIYGFNVDKKRDTKNNISLGQQVIQRNLPNRQMRRKFNDDDYTYEYIRKTLIVLASYMFWYMQEVGQFEEDYEAWMNRLLLLNNFEELYECNPFDWLMLKCAKGIHPIKLFREITEEVI